MYFYWVTVHHYHLKIIVFLFLFFFVTKMKSSNIINETQIFLESIRNRWTLIFVQFFNFSKTCIFLKIILCQIVYKWGKMWLEHCDCSNHDCLNLFLKVFKSLTVRFPPHFKLNWKLNLSAPSNSSWCYLKCMFWGSVTVWEVQQGRPLPKCFQSQCCFANAHHAVLSKNRPCSFIITGM